MYFAAMRSQTLPENKSLFKKKQSSDWLVPALLIALSAIPIIAGAFRMVWMASGVEITPENARFFAAPIPVVLHVFSVSVFCILGAFQFSKNIRTRHPGWHRASGRILVPAGLITAISGLWMSQFYQLPANDGFLLYVFRIVFGFAMIISLVAGLFAIWRRDFVQHQKWMMRGYAIALGTGTQAFTLLPWFLAVGPPDELARALLMGAGWAINLIVVEWILWRKSAQRSQKTLNQNKKEAV